MAERANKRVRTTVPMQVDDLAVFKRMAEVLGVSVGRAIADWCTDTAEGAEFVLTKMTQAKAQPGRVMREMHALAQGLTDKIGEIGHGVQQEEAAGRGRQGGRSPTGAGARPPRPVIRGESPSTMRTRGGHGTDKN